MAFELERRGMLLVISAPSGGGKSELVRRLVARDPRISYSVSYTSRRPRGEEADGREYHFVSRETFETMIAEGAFYEHAEVHGNLYGTSAEVVQAALGEGRDVVMDIDVQGALKVKDRSPGAVLVFILPPSMEALEERLRGRETDREEQIQLRLANAEREIESCPQYDYVIINETLDRTLEELVTITRAERCRASRLKVRTVS